MEFWSIHRITLIAYETQYIHSKKEEKHNSTEESSEKKKCIPKKNELQYESGFLKISSEPFIAFEVENLIDLQMRIIFVYRISKIEQISSCFYERKNPFITKTSNLNNWR